MKLDNIIPCLLAAGLLLAGGLTITARAAEEVTKEGKPKLKAQAKVSKADAKKTALAEVKKRGLKKAKVKACELEEEKGKLIWSFDIKTKGTKDITEVQVDAKTGEIVSVETESAAAEAKEGKADKKKEKKNQDEKEEKK